MSKESYEQLVGGDQAVTVSSSQANSDSSCLLCLISFDFYQNGVVYRSSLLF